MESCEIGISSVQLISLRKTARAAKNDWDNNHSFKRVDSGNRVRPRTLHNVHVTLLYDCGSGSISFYKGS